MKHALLIAVTSAAILSGCGTSDGTSASSETLARDEFDTAAMLQNLADNIVIPQYQRVAEQAQTTATAINSYCAAIGSDSETDALNSARTEWRSLNQAWQFSEAFILGPVEENGGNLRNRVYSYNAQGTNACGIDQAVVLNRTNDFDITGRSNTSRGIDALGYLLHNDNLNHNCPSIISETQGWDDLGDNTRRIQRCQYAEVVIGDVIETAARINREWSSDADNYRTTFLNPLNAANSLSAVSDALFFVDKDIKDARLGGPLGRVGCTPVDCTGRETVEAPYSQQSYANLVANLQGFEAMVFGNGDISFDDLINSVSAQELNQSLQSNIDSAISLINAQTNSLASDVDAIDSDQAIAECEMAIAAPSDASNYPVCQIYGYVKALSDSLKTEFILATNLDIPDRAQSDND